MNGGQMAVHCEFLLRAVDPGLGRSFAMTCLHPVREGAACVGPFLEDIETACGLWQRHPKADQIPMVKAEPWRGRRRG